MEKKDNLLAAGMDKPELLEVIRQKASAMYISDIPVYVSEKQLKAIMARIPREDYSDEEWDEAIQYCLHK